MYSLVNGSRVSKQAADRKANEWRRKSSYYSLAFIADICPALNQRGRHRLTEGGADLFQFVKTLDDVLDTGDQAAKLDFLAAFDCLENAQHQFLLVLGESRGEFASYWRRYLRLTMEGLADRLAGRERLTSVWKMSAFVSLTPVVLCLASNRSSQIAAWERLVADVFRAKQLFDDVVDVFEDVEHGTKTRVVRCLRAAAHLGFVEQGAIIRRELLACERYLKRVEAQAKSLRAREWLAICRDWREGELMQAMAMA